MTDTTYLKKSESESIEVDEEVTDTVRTILDEVRNRGDEAVAEYTQKFDGIDLDSFKITTDEIEAAAGKLDAGEREAIENTVANVREFHEEQRKHIESFEKEFKPGIKMGQRVLPIETAGIYVPGGRHPLVASPAMTIVPANVAGVDRIVACAPPQDDGTIQPAQLYAMEQAGVDEVYCIGGSQAIGSMAYGTETVPEVDVVAGPGNVFTTEAKRQVYGHVGVDFLAGPTEVLIIADKTADVELVATDLLAQAEHDPNSCATLISLDRNLAEAVESEIQAQLPTIDTEEVARESWENNGEVVVVDSKKGAIDLANEYAMEHVQVMADEPRSYVDGLRNYGSLFLGEHAPVVFGDKAVGTNHCLPTKRVARYSSGVWVGTYLKTPTHQELTAEGAAQIAPWAAKICELEGTHAHQISAEKRERPTGEADAPPVDD